MITMNKDLFRPDMTMLIGFVLGVYILPTIIAQIHKRR